MQTGVNLFGHIPPVPLDPAAAIALQRFHGLATAINTEKARSELLVAPLLAEVWRIGNGRIALFSGVTFDADPAAESVGVCDFILGYPPQFDYVTHPVVMVTEAKNENIMGGLWQCAAEMVGAQRFNRGRTPPVSTIYGCVTNGVSWKFLRLNGTLLEIDITAYDISAPQRILALLLNFVGLAPAAPVAS